jgi:hypothetical protein
VRSGYANGSWSGNGITSTLANNGTLSVGYAESASVLGPSGGIFAGEIVDATAILIRLTRYGDANLDGVVNGADFSLFASNFGKSGTWNLGDFNHDGVIDGADLSLLVSNFGGAAPGVQPGFLSQADYNAVSQFNPALPEPSAMIWFSAFSLLCQRRRQPRI